MATSSDRLQGAELIDCARANAGYSIEVAAERCGYGQNVSEFEDALRNAYDSIGVSLTSFSDMLKHSPEGDQVVGEIVAPDTVNQL